MKTKAILTPKPNKKDFTKPFLLDSNLIQFDSKGYAKQAQKYIEENQFKIDMHDELLLALTKAVVLLPQNGKFGDTPTEFKYENKTTELIYQLLKQAEQE